MTGDTGNGHTRWGVAVIGTGYWGPNHVRNFSRHPDFEVRVLCDMSVSRLEAVANEHRISRYVTDSADVMSDPDIDLVVVATPTWTHFELARAAILAGKHVLVMKPLAGRLDHAEELVDLAERQGVILAVDHTFLFTGAVHRLRAMVDSGELGDLYYIDSVRINLGLFQPDVNVVWDLAAHDVSIMDYLMQGELPHQVSAVGAAHAGSPTENVAYVTLRYGHSTLAQIHVNWLAPAKVRRTIVGGSKRMVIYDDTEPSEKLRVYDKGVTISTTEPLTADPELGLYQSTSGHSTSGVSNNGNGSGGYGVDAGRRKRRFNQMVSYRTGDMFAPQLDDREALANEVDDLAAALRSGSRPRSDGHAGLRIVRVLDAAQRSMHENSTPVAPMGAAAIRAASHLEDGRPVVRIPVVPTARTPLERPERTAS